MFRLPYFRGGLSFLLLSGFTVARAESIDGLVSSLRTVESRLKGVNGICVATAGNPAAQGLGGPDGRLGRLRWSYRRGETTMIRRVAGAELEGIRGMRDSVWIVQPPKVTWYEVYPEFPTVPGIGDIQEQTVYVWPLIGRAVDGILMSDYLRSLTSSSVTRNGADLDVSGRDASGNTVSLTFDSAHDLIARTGEIRSAKTAYRWKVSNMRVAKASGGDLFFPTTASVEIGPEGPDLQRVEIAWPEFGTPGAITPPPRMTTGSLIVQRDEQNVYRSNPDGTLSYYERLGVRKRTPFPLGLFFIGTSTVALLGSLWLLARSKRSAPLRSS